MSQHCFCSLGCQLHPLSPHFPPRKPFWSDETATPDEQRGLKEAHNNGAHIEAKGRDTIDCGYEWATTPNPRWDFYNNHYRIASPEA